VGCSVDKYYAGTCTCFLKKFSGKFFRQTCLKVRGQECSKKGENSNPFAHLASINEDEEVLGSLGEENPEEAELGRYIEVLQARKNEMVSGKKAERPPNASLTQYGPAERSIFGRKDVPDPFDQTSSKRPCTTS